MVIRLHGDILPSKSAGHPLSSPQRAPFLPSHSPSQVAVGASVGIGHSDWSLSTRREADRASAQ